MRLMPVRLRPADAFDQTLHVTASSLGERRASRSWSWQGPRTRVTAVLTVATVLNYLVWLAWDQAKDVNPATGRATGPYEPWQVIGVGAVLLLLGLIAGWQRHVVLAIVVIPTVFAACWVIDAATQRSTDANPWPFGSVFVAAGCVLGTAIFATPATASRATW
jgi:hypothetical protein